MRQQLGFWRWPEQRRHASFVARNVIGSFLSGAIVAVALIFVFAHGCHGPDEDHEPAVAPGSVERE